MAPSGSRYRGADGAAETPAAKGGHAAPARRDPGLLYLFAGTGRGRRGHIGASGGGIGGAPGADQGEPRRRPGPDPDRRGRPAHPALPPAPSRPPLAPGPPPFPPPP